MEDGKPDVIGIFNNSVMVYLGKGDGTFAAGVPHSLPPSGNYSFFLILGDVNGDGKTDVTVVNLGLNTPGQVIVLLGNGDGTLQSPKSSTGVVFTGNFPNVAVEGDFNGDGKTDLAINSSPICNGTCQGTYNISLLLGNGDGTFQAPMAVISGNGPLAGADVNGDGKLDLVLQSDPTVSQIYLGNGNGTFANANNYVLRLPRPGTGSPQSIIGIAIADFNGDGKPDIAVGGDVLLGNGNGTFQGIPIGVVQGTIGGQAIGDFEKKGTPDVAALTSQQIGSTYLYNVNILSNNGSGALSLIHTYALQEAGSAIVTADFNGDGNLDLVVFGIDPSSGDWNYIVMLGNGNGSFQSPIVYAQNVQAAVSSVIVADFNGDGKPDIAATLGNGTLAVLIGNGNGTFASPAAFFDGDAAYLVSGDFNGDGKLDLAAGSALSANPVATALLFGNGDGTFQPAVFSSSLNNFSAQFTADLNNDGKPDLVSHNQVALGKGDGTFTLLPVLSNQVNAIADFNSDGKPDVFRYLLLRRYSDSVQRGHVGKWRRHLWGSCQCSDSDHRHCGIKRCCGYERRRSS